MKITSKQLRRKWLDFYIQHGHVDIGAVSLIGDGKTGVMFNVAGMQPLMPYLLGKPHQKGKRLTNVQGCVRTVDIDEVGDPTHFTFFEMMGNWSLGDYFKKEKTAWTIEILTKVFGLDKNKICSTVFAGNESAPRDDETANLLLSQGIKKENIFFLADNWWELDGTTHTPCGPDNEWFYPRWDKPTHPGVCDINCNCGRFVEIGNDVYMQYEKLDGNKYAALKNKNVDTGFGFERMLMFLNGVTDGYKTDLFSGVISFMENALNIKYGQDEQTTKSMRIIADHMRTTVMLIGDVNGILPSNIGAGYVLRRIMRRAIRHAKKINLPTDNLLDIAKIYIEQVYDEAYPLLKQKEEYILTSIKAEIDKFNKTLELGNKEFEKVISGLERKNQFMRANPNFVEDKTISGKSAFRLYDTFGFPIELTCEMAKERGYDVDIAGFNEAFKAHQELARTTNAGVFKGGLADNGEETTKLHTACHLMLAGLRHMFGTTIEQKGSNITSERLRFDFNFDRKLTDEEVKTLEDFVNNAINRKIDIVRLEMPFKQAKQQGAYGVHKAEEDEIVSIYKIGDVDFQICGGPHVANTSELKHFKIAKQEAVSAGVRRIKAVLN